jgi:hypothetical protein
VIETQTQFLHIKCLLVRHSCWSDQAKLNSS